MKFRSVICAGLALTCGTPVWAQSSVTLYGLIDQGIEFVNHATKGQGEGYRMGDGTATSFFGMRGTEGLGGGLKTIWDLQGGFSPSTGVSRQGPRLFGRQAYVGLDGRFGRLTFGRQYTMRFFGTSFINPFGTGAQGLTTLDNGVANARADNSISYRYFLGSFEAGVNYSFGRDGVNGDSSVATNCPGQAGDWKACKEWSLLLKYDAHTWGVASSYERDYGGPSVTYGGLTSASLTDSRFTLGGYVQLFGAKFGLGWLERINEAISTPRSNLVWLTGTVPVGPAFSIDGMLAQIKYEHSPNKAVAIVLRGEYFLSKSTFLYVTGEHISNGGTLAFAATTLTPVPTPAPGGSQISVIAGIRHTF